MADAQELDGLQTQPHEKRPKSKIRNQRQIKQQHKKRQETERMLTNGSPAKGMVLIIGRIGHFI